jgi:ABC-type transport system involved in multi-copper enzyme maturation permease subunit
VTWLAGRQSRAQIAVALAAVAVLALAAGAAGRGDAILRPWLSALVVVIPGILGMFWGAPLVAGELESGTFRLAWTQDVSRRRWPRRSARSRSTRCPPGTGHRASFP